MPHMNLYALLAVALSNLITASPLVDRASAAVPNNVANGTIVAGCTLFHSVAGGETCVTIESQFSISDALFRTLNPEINSACSNLIAGAAYCVQAANTTTPTSTTSSTVPPTTTTSSTQLPTTTTSSTQLPTTTSPPTTTTAPTSSPTAVPPPNNVSPGTITAGCTSFFTLPPGITCLEIEAQFNITDAFFRSFNPQINAGCTNLIAGQAYCVAGNNTIPSVPGNVAPGTVTNGCTVFHTVVTGDICDTIDAQFNISFSQFLTLNPEVNVQCTNLILGLAYCVQSTTIPGSS